MTESPRLIRLGSIDGGETPIEADVTRLGSAVAVSITLTSAYTLASPRPAGFPTRPEWTGCAVEEYVVAGAVIQSGSVIKVLQCEALALIAAGAATLN